MTVACRSPSNRHYRHNRHQWAMSAILSRCCVISLALTYCLQCCFIAHVAAASLMTLPCPLQRRLVAFSTFLLLTVSPPYLYRHMASILMPLQNRQMKTGINFDAIEHFAPAFFFSEPVTRLPVFSCVLALLFPHRSPDIVSVSLPLVVAHFMQSLISELAASLCSCLTLRRLVFLLSLLCARPSSHGHILFGNGYSVVGERASEKSSSQ